VEPIDVVEGIVRHLMARPPAVGLSPEWDFALLYRDLATRLQQARDLTTELKARRLPGPATMGVVRIDLPQSRLFARIENGRISRFWRGAHSG
jgi:hypothetical protein